MIILKKYPKSDLIIGSSLMGTFDGINQVFKTESPYESGKIMITFNGQTLYSDNDFVEVSDDEIKLVYLYPDDPKSLKATYVRG